jgi:hypothetical protein
LPLRNIGEPLRAYSLDVGHADCKGFAGAVTRTEFGRPKIRGLSPGSCRGSGSPRPEGVLSKDAEGAAGCEMALDIESVLDGGVNGQETLG